MTAFADDGRLIGGTELADDRDHLPAVVKIWGTCTAAKVGPRHILTAAHCFLDGKRGTESDSAKPDAKLWITDKNKPTSSAKDWHQVTVEKVHLHPSYTNAFYSCASRDCRNAVGRYSSDVAVVVIKEETPTIATAKVDYGFLDTGAVVTLSSYGCEDGAQQTQDYGDTYDGRLKYALAYTQAASALYHSGFDPAWQSSVYRYNSITPGRGWTTDHASLCPGDSGGPLFRGRTGEWVVGVNAYYSFNPNDPTGVSRTNWHARLSLVADWLRSALR